ncbi:putative ribonuclease H-like domain-containing protein [Tanacetum coccineum]
MAYSSSGSLNSSRSDTEVIKILKIDVKLRDKVLAQHRQRFEKAEKERDDLILILENFQNSSKNLSNLLDSQVCVNHKSGVGYVSQVGDKNQSDVENVSQMDEKNKTGEGYHAVPPPYTGNFMPPKPKLVLADTNKSVLGELVTSVPIVESDSDEEDEPKPKVVKKTAESKTVKQENISKTNRPNYAKIEFVRPQMARQFRQVTYSSSKRARGNQRNWNNMKIVQKPVWNNAVRVNHHNSARITHPYLKINFVPTAVLTRSGKVPINTAKQNLSKAIVSVNTVRPINTVVSRPKVNGVNTARLRSTVNTSRPKATVNATRQRVAVNTARLNAVLKAVKGNMGNAVKASTYSVWRLKQKVLDHGNPEQELQERGIFDSSYSRHMTGNKSYLTEFEEINGGFVAFGGNSRGGKITWKDFKLANENHVLLKVPRKDNMHSVDLKNIVPKRGLTCLYAKATSDEVNLWHRRLGHVNFKTLNKLVKGNLVRDNGVAERKNRTLIKAARTMLTDSKLPTTFWTEAVITACYVQNRVLVIKPHNKTPYELFLGRKPTLGFMRPFGCPITILNTIDYLGKFEGKAYEGNQTNGSTCTKACQDAGKARVEIVPGKEYILLPLWTADSLLSSQLKNFPNDGFKPSEDAEKNDDDGQDDQEKEDDVNSTNIVNATSINEVNAVGAKTCIELPNDPNMPPLEEIVYPKDDEDVGAEADITNLDTHILVSPIPTTRIHKDRPLDQVIGDVHSVTQTRIMTKKLDEHALVMDVKSAFLYDRIEEEVYVCQLIGFEDLEFPNKVYKVEKALYGLHQAPRAWYETLSTYLLENGFKRGTIDKNLFIKKDKHDILLVQVYVDDIIFGSTKKSWCTEFEGMMHKSQDKYVADILKKFDFSTVKIASTPMETNKALLKDTKVDDVDVHLYRSMIGSLMYLTASRPDIIYLKGQPKLGLWYPKDSPLDLEAYSDSDYAGASLDKKSTIRGCQFLGRRLVSWQCKKQTVVANSTTKAEYVAAANCYGQVIKIYTDLNVADLLTKAFDVGKIQFLIANIEQITVSSIQLKKTYTHRKPKNITKIPQSSDSTNLVVYEAVYEEMYDSVERAATTATSLDAEQDSSNINKT